MMKTIAILATAALASTSVNAGTNKTLAPTPGIDRPNAPPPITPFPTEPNVVRIIICVVVLVVVLVWWTMAAACCLWRRYAARSAWVRGRRDGSCKRWFIK